MEKYKKERKSIKMYEKVWTKIILFYHVEYFSWPKTQDEVSSVVMIPIILEGEVVIEVLAASLTITTTI